MDRRGGASHRVRPRIHRPPSGGVQGIIGAAGVAARLPGSVFDAGGVSGKASFTVWAGSPAEVEAPASRTVTNEGRTRQLPEVGRAVAEDGQSARPILSGSRARRQGH